MSELQGEWSAGVVAADGARLSYRERGSGPALLLLHAGVADQRMWDPLAALLADRFRIVTFDLRGFGETTSEPGLFSPSADVGALLDALAIDRATLVGASFGGLVTLEFLTLAPGRVERAVLLAPPLPDHPWSAEMLAFFDEEEAALGEDRIEDAVALNVRAWAGHADERVQALVASMQEQAFRCQLAVEIDSIALDPPLAARLATIRVPVSVAYGDRDFDDFEVIARRLAAELPQATLHHVRGAGHLIALERPDATARLLLDPAGAGSVIE